MYTVVRISTFDHNTWNMPVGIFHVLWSKHMKYAGGHSNLPEIFEKKNQKDLPFLGGTLNRNIQRVFCFVFVRVFVLFCFLFVCLFVFCFVLFYFLFSVFCFVLFCFVLFCFVLFFLLPESNPYKTGTLNSPNCDSDDSRQYALFCITLFLHLTTLFCDCMVAHVYTLQTWILGCHAPSPPRTICFPRFASYTKITNTISAKFGYDIVIKTCWCNLRVRAFFHETVRVCHVYCNFKIGFTCRITVVFGTLKDGSLLINSLPSNICFSYRNMFQNGVDALSKIVDAFLSNSSKFHLVRIIR